MPSTRRVLGLDLALRRYRDIGTAMLSFEPGGDAMHVETDVISWPTGKPDVKSIARIVANHVERYEIHAVAIDATLAWREPEPDIGPPRPGVGRWAERLLHTQSKTGPPGRTFPKTQQRWTQLGIELGQLWLQTAVADLVEVTRDQPCETLNTGRFYLLESYPTATWRAAGCKPLPGKSTFRKGGEDLQQWKRQLAERFDLQWPGEVTTHDDLQAVVTALPAVAWLGGPVHAQAFGLPMRWREAVNPPQPFEGLIWIARPSTTQVSV